MAGLDVLLIGAYGLADKSSGISGRTRLACHGHPATLDFLQRLVARGGDLALAEQDLQTANASRLISRSLNAIYLWSFLTEHGVSAEVISYFAFEQARFRALAQARPRIIAISTTFMTERAEAVEIARLAKELSPESLVVAGGVKVLKSYKKRELLAQGYFKGEDTSALVRNNFFFDAQQDAGIDAFVVEECGELALLELARSVKEGRDHRSTPNLAYWEGETLVSTPRAPEPFTFEAHPIAWDRVPAELLGNEIPVRAGTGCPFHCAFCDFVDLHKVRLRPLRSLVDELTRIQERFPGKPIWFTDDNLFTNRRRTTEIAQAILDRKLKFRWRAFFRSDAIGEENAELLAASGCTFPLLGVESGDDEILKAMDKNLDREQTLRAVRLLNGAGIGTVSTVIVGFPGETAKSVLNTAEMLSSFPSTADAINFYMPFVFRSYPLAPVFAPAQRARFGLRGLYDDWAHATMNAAQANEQLEVLFKNVDSTLLQYPESATSLAPAKTRPALAARALLVKSGTCEITAANAAEIYRTFAPLLG